MYLKQYIQCCNGISLAVSAILIFKNIFCQNSRNKGPLNIFIGFIYGLNLTLVMSQYFNFSFCSNKNDSKYICIATWITFTFSLQSLLSFVTVLTFSGLYFLSTKNTNFLTILTESTYQLSLISIIIPLLINTSPLISYIGNNKIVFKDQFNILSPILSAFQIVTFLIPLLFYILLITLFSILSVFLIKNDKISLYFQKKLRFSIVILMLIVYLVYIPFILLMMLDLYNEIFELIYQIYLGIINLNIILYAYIYSINQYLDELIIIKLTHMGKLQLSKIESQLSANSKCSEIESVRIQYKI